MRNNGDTQGPPSDSFLTVGANLKARSMKGFIILFIVLQILISAMLLNIQSTNGWLIGCPEATPAEIKAP
ncbi:MAG TPA: hypothetical protein VJ327_03670 [Patescibacteria group bacterium]|nr:hypothetical protein [Patescibacteria group bacterium]